jgi:hypothetical protein
MEKSHKINAVNFKHLTKKQQKKVREKHPNINFDNKEELNDIIIEVEAKAKTRVNKIVKAIKKGEIDKIQRDKEYQQHLVYLEDIGYDKEEEEIEDKIYENEKFIKERDKLINKFKDLNYNDITFKDWLYENTRLNEFMKKNKKDVIDYYNTNSF